MRRVVQRAHTKRNDIYVSNNGKFQYYVKRAKYLLIQEALKEVVIHGLGAAVMPAIKLSLYLQQHMPSLTLAPTTSTEEIIDQYDPNVDSRSCGRTSSRTRKPTTSTTTSSPSSTVVAAANGGTVHPLANTFYFFYMPKRPKNMSDYLNGLQMIPESINSAERFWSYYSHMIRPVDEFSSLSDIYLFKEGIRPVWEDPENQNGGKFVVKVRRNFTSKWWEDLLLAFIGEQLDAGDTINGIVISFRSADNSLIGIWNKDCNDAETKERIAASLRNLFRIEKVDYKPHFYRMTKEESLGREGGDDSQMMNGGGNMLLNSSIDGVLEEL
eukprot:gene229-279_t